MAKLNTPQKLLLSRADIKALGIWQSNSTLLRLELLDRFPRRIRLSAASICWDREEIMTWISERKDERSSWHYADSDFSEAGSKEVGPNSTGREES